MHILSSTSCLPTSSATNAAALGREAVIVAHDELRFNLLYCVHSDTNHDQQRGAAEVEGEAETVGDKCRKCVEVATDEPQVVEVDTSHEHRRNQLNDDQRSEEHTSELQSLRHLVCRLLLEKT